MLRAKQPEAVTKRLKLFMFGPAGVGKTTAAIQFPKSYIIDCEKGAQNYGKLITASGSAVFETNDMNEVLDEVKALLTEKHGYRTLIIDPITTLYNDLLDKCEAQVGADFGRHYGAANKVMKRLANLIMALDMNVVITAHAKTEYGQNYAKLGYTFDGWKQLDYWFDLVVELGKKNKKRFGKVVKTRLDSFADDDVFEWSYDAIKRRYDVAMLEKEAGTVKLASPERVREIKDLLSLVRLPEGMVDKWFAKSGVDLWEDMPGDILQRCIEFVRGRLPTTKPAASLDVQLADVFEKSPAPPRQTSDDRRHRDVQKPEQRVERTAEGEVVDQQTGEVIPPPRCTGRQVQELRELLETAKGLGLATPQTAGKWHAKYGVKAFEELSSTDCMKLIQTLRGKLDAAPRNGNGKPAVVGGVPAAATSAA
jgi:hypothetical protein